MPQKHNPVDATGAIASARLAVAVVPVILSAMVQEHERAAGGWQAEWQTLAGVLETTGSALAAVAGIVEGLTVYPDRMRANLDLTAPGPSRRQVNAQIADPKATWSFLRPSTDQRPHARSELAEAERLQEIVVGARVERGYAIVDADARAQHDDGRPASRRPQPPADLDPIAAGEP